jgi:hypothetical protein
MPTAGAQSTKRDHAPRRGIRDNALAVGMRAFFQIAGKWKLSNEEAMALLGHPSKSTFHNWKNGNVSHMAYRHDLASRISYVLGIFKALEILFPDPARADEWLKRANDAPLFGGRSALERMLGGNVSDLFVVRQYLDAQRGG